MRKFFRKSSSEGKDKDKKASGSSEQPQQQQPPQPQWDMLPDSGPPAEWDSNDVIRWIKRNDLNVFKEKLHANDIGGKQLMEISEMQFQTMFRTKFRKPYCDKLWEGIQMMKKL
eukprot:m.20799 g.20799  ORF g.20799 m.20799 type:complete len:114 (+) comp6955_c0_seq1:102-443(+)